MLSILHTASRFQIHDFYGTFGTVMDIAGRIGLIRALYMPDKPNLHIQSSRIIKHLTKVLQVFNLLNFKGYRVVIFAKRHR